MSPMVSGGTTVSGAPQVRPPAGSRLLGRIGRLVFASPPGRFYLVLFAVAVARCGIWYMPSSVVSRHFAADPFTNPYADPEGHYLVYNWLGAFLAWLVRATSLPAFVAVHAVFSFAFSALFYRIAFRALPDRQARAASIVFFLLPASTTAYYWIGTDSITLFLLLAAFLFPRRPAWALPVGVLLGLHHFEQGVLATSALAAAVVLSGSARSRLRCSLAWALALLGGVLAGRVLLAVLFRVAGIETETDRLYWVGRLLPDLLYDSAGAVHYLAFAMLGVAWFVMGRYVLDRGVGSLPMVIPFAGLALVQLITFDQTRVFAIVSFPLLVAYWLLDEDLLASLSDRVLLGLLGAWLVIPWAWVIGGRPQGTVLPHLVAYVVGKATGWFDPPSDPFWPFTFDPAI